MRKTGTSMVQQNGSGTVVVTGCAGFIGWKVCEALLERGWGVVGVDNLNEAYDVRLKEWRLSRLLPRPNFRFQRLDVTDRAGVEKLFEALRDERKPQAVINLAARAGVRYSVEDPWVYFATNVTGTLNLLDACRRTGVPKFVLASTSSLYGDANPRPFREDQSTDHPVSPYAASKKAAETLCYTYHHLHGLDVSVLRYFTVYGPAGRPDMSPFRFVQWIFEGRPVVIYGDGQQERDFTYVDDIAAGTVAALRPLGYEIINLGSDRPWKLLDVVRLMEERIGRRAELVFREAHRADVRATWADVSKAAKLLDWRPATPLEEGVERMVAWYREERRWAREIATE